MAKGDPNSVTVQYKVHLKPTAIGRLVIERLERPHLDVSPELRRFIELGYAAERAGFILDGTVLRHAGRMWDMQPDFGVQPQTETGATDGMLATGRQRAHAPRSTKPALESTSLGTGKAEPITPSQTADNTPTNTPSLRSKLRDLSG